MENEDEYFGIKADINFPEPLPLIENHMIQGRCQEDLFQKGRGFLKNRDNKDKTTDND